MSIDREERWQTCQKYIIRAGDIPRAKALAAKDGFAANSMVWITALAKLLPAIEAASKAPKKKQKRGKKS